MKFKMNKVVEDLKEIGGKRNMNKIYCMKFSKSR